MVYRTGDRKLSLKERYQVARRPQRTTTTKNYGQPIQGVALKRQHQTYFSLIHSRQDSNCQQRNLFRPSIYPLARMRGRIPCLITPQVRGWGKEQVSKGKNKRDRRKVEDKQKSNRFFPLSFAQVCFFNIQFLVDMSPQKGCSNMLSEISLHTILYIILVIFFFEVYKIWISGLNNGLLSYCLASKM